MKVAIQTLGCKVNQAESASMEGLLRERGIEVVSSRDRADVCIVNTCTVTSRSDAEARRIIRQIAKSGSKVIVTGCYAQLRPDELKRIEGVEAVIGNSEKKNIIAHLKKFDKGNGSKGLCKNPLTSASGGFPYYSTRSRAFLKIQDGCNFSCTYCAVPLARGKSRSLPVDKILSSISDLCENGYREIILTGIHIGSYGKDLNKDSSLLSLIQLIADNFHDIRIRLSSIEPQEFDFRIVPFIRSGLVCAHLHVPLQSGSDKILRLMGRGYTTAFYSHVIHRISTECPRISIGTDIITGFPGETKDDFEETVKFLSELPLSYLHVFPYSSRPDTKAASYSNIVDGKIKKERVQRLLSLSKFKKKNYYNSQLGADLDVIVEKVNVTNGYFDAISDNYLKIFVDAKNLQPKQRLKVKVISLTDDSLLSKPLEKSNNHLTY